jgi:polysaccharide export outer membrane protein
MTKTIQTAIDMSQVGVVRRRQTGPALACAILAATGGAFVAGCTEFPSGGPNASTVVSHAEPKGRDGYDVVRVTPAVLSTLSQAQTAGLAGAFADGALAPPSTIGLGDVISITIWDFGDLLGSSPGQSSVAPPPAPPAGTAPTGAPALPTAGSSTIPQQAVDQNGNIMVPYAGTVHAAGLTTTELQRAIATSLEHIMIHPQVVVFDSLNQSTFVTVAGDAAHPGRVPLPTAGLRLLDAIALSGGTTGETTDMAVRVTRGGVTRTSRLVDIVRTPSENIYLRGDDLVFLDKEPQSVVVLGASNHNGQILFGKSDFTLAEALGNAGGLTDIQADPSGVFVFRYEPASTVKALGLPGAPPLASTNLIPVVYQIDLKSPVGLFMVEAFPMRDRDVVYLSNSDTVQIAKVFHFLLTGSSIFKSSSVVSN